MDALLRPSDPEPLRAFTHALAGKDPKTIAAYLSTLRDFVVWLATRPGGTPFQLALLTETALDAYMQHLEQQQAPRTRSRALSALKRFAAGPSRKATCAAIPPRRFGGPPSWPWRPPN